MTAVCSGVVDHVRHVKWSAKWTWLAGHRHRRTNSKMSRDLLGHMTSHNMWPGCPVHLNGFYKLYASCHSLDADNLVLTCCWKCYEQPFSLVLQSKALLENQEDERTFKAHSSWLRNSWVFHPMGALKTKFWSKVVKIGQTWSRKDVGHSVSSD